MRWSASLLRPLAEPGDRGCAPAAQAAGVVLMTSLDADREDITTAGESRRGEARPLAADQESAR